MSPPLRSLFNFKILKSNYEWRKKTKSSLEEVNVFPLINYPLQYMEMPLPSYSFTYISFEQLFFCYFCIFVSFFKTFFYHLPIFSQEVDQQNNYMVTGVVPLDSGGEITGRGSGAAGQSWMRIVGNFSGQTQVKKVEVSGSDSEWVTD